MTKSEMNLLALADELGVPIEDLLYSGRCFGGGKGAPPPPPPPPPPQEVKKKADPVDPDALDAARRAKEEDEARKTRRKTQIALDGGTGGEQSSSGLAIK